MFGNARGWTISAIIAALVAVLIWKQGTPERMSRATGAFPQAMTPINLPVDPKALVQPGSGNCDAGELYRRAADDYLHDPKRYKSAAPATRGAGQTISAIDLIVQAAGCSRMTLFGEHPEQVVNYENSRPMLSALQELGRMTVQEGMRSKSADLQHAQSTIEAAFLMGEHLYQERIVFEEMNVGLNIMSNAAHFLALLDMDDARRNSLLASFEQGVGEYQKRTLTPLWAVISGIGPDALETRAGDVLQIARESDEPMWQTEALLKLGRMRWQQGVRFGDQRGAAKTLREAAERTDVPQRVKAAAIAARDLSVEKFRMFGGGG